MSTPTRAPGSPSRAPARPAAPGAPAEVGRPDATQRGAEAGGVGTSPIRPDGRGKVTGEFAYGSDLWMDDMIWGVTLRSPHPHARIRSIAIGEALATAGVYAVLLSDDVPGENAFGLEHADQPVLASDVVRYAGEPVALVAADHPEVARVAARKIVVDYEVLEPITDAVAALEPGVPQLHPTGNLVRHLKIRKGDPAPRADVVVTTTYDIGMQDQAFLGPEAGLAVPDGTGGVDLFVSTQWLHADQRQVCAALGLPPDRVRLTLAGVGGAFGGREDLSMHVHACLLALHTGKPVKMMYSREESFFGHVHRHPARITYEHGANRDGALIYVRSSIYLDGGAYASSTPAVVGNAGTMGAGPYVVPNVHIDAYGVYTNNPPCGAMRGFGSVQAAFGYEAQMDKLAAALGMDPVDFRCRNAMEMGSTGPTGQVIDSPAPVVEMLRRVQQMPLPPEGGRGAGSQGNGVADLRHLPGGVGNTTHGEGIKRGVGYAVGYKNVGFSEGFDDYSTARVRLEIVAGEPVVTVHTAAAEVGQGLVTIEQQICRTELGVAAVVNVPKDTEVGSAGSTSASRQTYVTGGAVKSACELIRERLVKRVADRLDVDRDQPAACRQPGLVRCRRAAREDRRFRRRRGVRGNCAVAAPADVPCGPGDRAGVRARAVRFLGAPGGGRCRHRPRAAQGRRAGLRAGRRRGHEPAGRRRPDPGRQRARPRPGDHGGDPGARRDDQESLLHRLPDPDHPRRPADADRCARIPRPARAVRPARRGRAAHDLFGPRGRGGHPGGDGPRSHQGPCQARRCNGNSPVTRPPQAGALDYVAQDLDRLLAVADAELESGYTDWILGRQPVHTAYVPAHTFGPQTVRQWGAHALAALEEFAPGPANSPPRPDSRQG